MKRILMKLLKILLILVLVSLAVLLVFAAVIFLKWPWWVGFFVLLGILGAWVGFVFVRKLLLRRSEQYFVDQVIEQDRGYLETFTGKERESLLDMQERWKEAIETLRKSHLRKRGNPLYVLPWYLVVGESGSGKSTAIKSARLSSTFAEVSRASGLSGTRNCDWWFFEEAILIDTAGRFAIPVDQSRDKEEWHKFLGLLTKFRKKEPLNGLVVTVAADKLLSAKPETLEEDGRTIRQRVDELMRVLGAKFPVYVLVTKCDRVKGMTQFCDLLPEKSLSQAMGLVNRNMNKDVDGFQSWAMNTISERLRDIRLLLLHKSQDREIDPGLLLFPEEFERLKPGLGRFIQGAFRENPYQETPILRGLFFSSGRQEGTPYSHFLKSLGLIGEDEVLPGTDRGLFLYDIFSKIMPGDRNLFTLTERSVQWSRLTRNLGLTSWIALGVAVCGLLSYSFVKNLKTLRDVSNPPVLQGEILIDLESMNNYREAILHVEDQNSNWWIPRFGLHESVEMEGRLKERYCDLFRDGFLSQLDDEMRERMSAFSDVTDDAVIGRHVAFLVKRINLLRARLKGEGLEELEAMPQPDYEPSAVSNRQLLPEIRSRFQNLYLYNLIWRGDETRINREMNDLQAWLKQILVAKRNNMNWLVGWYNDTFAEKNLFLKNFWGGSLQEKNDVAIRPAFTEGGKSEIDAFINEIEAALPEKLVIAEQKLAFQKWYRTAYIDSWRIFAAAFPEGKARLADRNEWQSVAGTMGSERGPYFYFIKRATDELGEYRGAEDQPAWMAELFNYQAAREAAKVSDAKDNSLLKKAMQKGGRIVSVLGKGLDKLSDESRLEALKLAAAASKDYDAALGEIAQKSASRREAFKMTGQVFSEDPVTGDSPFYKAVNAVERMKKSFQPGGEDVSIFWGLVSGPIDFLWEFYRNESACELQTLWEKEVLISFDPDSEQVDKFVKGPAAPFVDKSLRQKGYFAKKALGESLPIKPLFFDFSNNQLIKKPEIKIKDSYRVRISAMPTTVNADAEVKPHATHLEVQCGDRTLALVNLNFPVREDFNWSPTNCGDVVFRIEVGNRTLIKRYRGDLPFRSFLSDFRGGKRTFRPNEFPDEADALKRMKIDYINVNYRFQGEQNEIMSLPTTSGVRARTPGEIAECWRR